MEIWKIYSQSTRIESKIIEKYIWPWWNFRKDISEKDIKKFIQDLKWLWIKNIILLKEADYKFYEKILEKAKKLWYMKLVKDNNMIKLYKIIY